MKKFLLTLLTIALFVTTAGPVQAATEKAPRCVKFDDTMYYARETWLRTAGYYDKNIGNGIDKAELQIAYLHDLLEKEGFTIAKREKDIKQFGRTTAIAASGLQNKYKAELLTSQGLTLPYGVIDEKGVEFLNQKYGCIEKSRISLKNQGMFVETEAAKLMKTAYVLSGVPATTKITLSYTNSAGSVVKVEKTGVRNGNGEIEWTAPSAIGTYKISVTIDGSDDKAEFTLKVLSRVEKSFSVVSPVSTTDAVQNGNINVKIEGTFANAEKAGTTIIEVQNVTSNAKTVLATNKKVADVLSGVAVKIPKDLPVGSYKVLVTYSTSLGSFTKESANFNVRILGSTPGSGDTTRTFSISSNVDSVKVGNNFKVKIEGNFDKSENNYLMSVELKKATDGELINLGTYKIVNLKAGQNIKIPTSVPVGSYTLVGTYSYNGNPIRKEAGSVLSVNPVVSTAPLTDDANGIDSGNSAGGTNSFSIVNPSSLSSVKAGGAIAVKADAPNIPNNAKVRIYLTGSGEDTLLQKDRTVRYCPPYPADCSSLKSNGIRVVIPKATIAGSYKIKAIVTLSDGIIVEDVSDTFTVTN